ncbi:transposase [Streptomyces sp. NPDC056049]|uniref:transposase n=1 Tax=Streptomyces sp. NPDC056049 TaxID=3345693 RepID=UPI0035D7CB7C
MEGRSSSDRSPTDSWLALLRAPGGSRRSGRHVPPVRPRRPIDGIRFRVRTGAPWRDIPAEYGPWSRVWDRFVDGGGTVSRRAAAPHGAAARMSGAFTAACESRPARDERSQAPVLTHRTGIGEPCAKGVSRQDHHRGTAVTAS